MTIQFSNGSKKTISVGISTFDDAEGLARTVKSVLGHVDYVIVVDGRYTNFNADHNYSKDWTMDFCIKTEGVYYERFSGWEYEKRQKIFDMAAGLHTNYLIILDSDEYMMDSYGYWKSSWDTFHKEIEDADKSEYHQFDYVFNLRHFVPGDWPQASNNMKTNAWDVAPRVFKDPSKLRYALQTHYRFAFKCIPDEMIINNPSIPLCIGPSLTLEGISFTTDAKYRSPEYLKVREEWSHDNMHEDRARILYQQLVKQGKANKVRDINIPHYYDKTGLRIDGKRPIINY